MAEGPVAALRSTQVPAMAPERNPDSLSEEEKNKIAECERILRFRDQVLSGSHPRIKAPAHLFAPKQSNESRSLASAPVSTPVSFSQLLGKTPPKGPRLSSANATVPANGSGSQVAANLRSFAANAQHSAPANRASTIHPPGLESSSVSSSKTSIPTGPKADTAKRHIESSTNAQFDPVLLTKSEDLIKAELQLQRQRLERALADQLQQHRTATKAAHAVEAPVEFDLAAVLMKALQLAQSSAPPQTDANIAANQSGSDSDSNETFYSSKHDTPESHLEQRIPSSGNPEVAQDRDDSPYEPPMVMDASPVPGQAPVVAIPPSVTRPFTATYPTTTLQEPPNPLAHAPVYSNPMHTVLPSGHNNSGASNTAQEATGVPMEVISSQESGEGSSSRDSGMAAGGQPSVQSRLQSVSRQMIEQAFGRRQSPILRAHNLSPVAPQPAHVSPLATSRHPQVPQQDAMPAQATSAQVAALRADHSNGSSPDSSPQGKANKKGKKNKKRKADRMAANNAPVPYIKPEPRSLSPVTAPQYSRQPNKRIRSAQQARQEQASDEPRYEEVVESTHLSSYPPRVYRDDRGPIYGNPTESYLQQNPRPVIVTETPRYEREYHEEPRPLETVRYVRRASPGAQPYPPAEVRTYRSVSRAAVDRIYPYYDSRDLPRTVIRPAADRDRSRSPVLVEERAPGVMGPPQLPTRIVVDEFGREYIEPPSRQEPVIIRRSVAPRPVYGDREDFHDPSRASSRIVRRSVAPASVHGEPEVVYERAPPPRAASVMPGPNRYDEEVVYRTPASPAGYPPAGYTTTRRVVARSEYPPEYRYYRERDYPSQPPSQPVGGYYEVRDPRSAMGGEPHRDYIVRSTTARPESSARPEVVRMSSVRPEPTPGEYGAPIRLDAQAMPPPRSYSVRPMAPPPPPLHQPQYVHQWPEYEARPEYDSRPAYREQVRGDDDGVTYVDSVPRDMYR
ncbi:hypothetical protein N0V93_007529 [Gnomoniopsis smithogilvyi]|uniref:Uncharacterized protein n=1 Tax=Gnomoniopsis smithogilvyi TaxID=1191159 RepID=A0A9W8YSV4_9PEZI|nr:hypothetical protein N0V93_007529 [Gnomoniopsis smithogilvyi]